MTQYIDKAALVAEIEKRVNFNKALGAYSRADECNAILSLIDTLEVKDLQEEPHCDERQFDELSKLQEGIGQIAKAVYEHKGKENSTVEKIREILIENSFDRMEIRGEISEKEDDLEKEICNYFNNWYFDEELDIMTKPNHYSVRFDDIKAVARHFAEWQKEKDKRNRTMSKGCGIEFPHFGARYPDARCCDGYLWDMDSWDESLGGFTIGGEEPCPVCNTEEWLDSVVDEDGVFKTREEALAYVEQLKKRYLNYE